MNILLAFPFRIFFLSTALWALLAAVLWALHISGTLLLPLAHAPLEWHRHEMLLGFLNPAIAGFLLTAVCVWTGTERLHGLPLLGLWLLWLTGRILATWGGPSLSDLSAAVNLAFLPLVAVDAGWRIVRSRQWPQLLLLGVLTLLWLTQAGSLLFGSQLFLNASLIVTAALMLIVGGRITPAFTANWLAGQGRERALVVKKPLLELLLLVSLLLLLVAVLLPWAALIPAAALTTALLALWRLLLWRGWLAWREPLLWILHVSLLWIPVALILLAGHWLLQWPAAAWQHALGIGAIGGLIYGVMTRVALGHTGRKLVLPSGVVWGYWLIQLAVMIRLLMAFTVLPWLWGLTLASTAWLLALALFLWCYVPILCAPRVDGKHG